MHAVCASLDHVAAAAGEPQETVGIEVAEVAGAQPAVDQGRGGRFRGVPVAGHDVVAAGTDLAGLARRSFAAVHAPHPDLDAVNRRADRADLRSEERRVGKRWVRTCRCRWGAYD